MEGKVLFFYLSGDLEIDELHAYIKLTEQISKAHGSFYIADDLSHFGTASPAVRRMVASWLARAPCRGVVLYGGSLAARTLVTLMLGALKLTGTLKFPATLVRNEEEARSWLRSQEQMTSASIAAR
jgi:hypothetical protein